MLKTYYELSPRDLQPPGIPAATLAKRAHRQGISRRALRRPDIMRN
ncbi:MAG: hypothetical protein HKN36_03285 [Hellea sp.]|nr:hypothetical protein [Hellea sp.]